ncbi:MAG: DNA cytosine methyltransferase [Planctomycetes bacterium]|nr:DNA cytosine methyltransferase [Planctomycetota bacterium]
MRVLVACEFSGIVRDAFCAKGHDAVSCDLLPTERLGNHLLMPVQRLLDAPWDLMIAHPPCRYLAVSGARWFAHRTQEQKEALAFVELLMEAPIPRIAIENPISVISTTLRKPDQIVQPWMFGHGETKATCLWLKNLPKLRPTKVVEGRKARVHCEPPTPDRWKRRSRTYEGIATAMAEQWGAL